MVAASSQAYSAHRRGWLFTSIVVVRRLLMREISLEENALGCRADVCSDWWKLHPAGCCCCWCWQQAPGFILCWCRSLRRRNNFVDRRNLTSRSYAVYACDGISLCFSPFQYCIIYCQTRPLHSATKHFRWILQRCRKAAASVIHCCYLLKQFCKPSNAIRKCVGYTMARIFLRYLCYLFLFIRNASFNAYM